MSFFSGNDPDKCQCGGIDCRHCRNEFPCRLDDYIIEPMDLANHEQREEYPAEYLANKLGLYIIIQPEYLEILEPTANEVFAEVLSWREAYLWLAGWSKMNNVYALA